MQRLNRIAAFGAPSFLLITGCDEQATSPGVATRDTAALFQTDSLAYTLPGEYRAMWGSVLSTYQDRPLFGDPLAVEWRTSNRFTLTAEPR